jgi:hypothetical protein
VNNRLRPGHDAAATAVYIDVILNLRVCSAAAHAATRLTPPTTCARGEKGERVARWVDSLRSFL